MNTILIGIAGGTGSGKTTLTKHLKKRFGDDITVIGHDSYYKRQDRPFEERCRQNYDHPDAFDTDLLVRFEHIIKYIIAGIQEADRTDCKQGNQEISTLPLT